MPDERIPLIHRVLTVHGAQENNLKNVDVALPLGVLTLITGVSGSGKSSLINGILAKVLSNQLNRSRVVPGRHKKSPVWSTSINWYKSTNHQLAALRDQTPQPIPVFSTRCVSSSLKPPKRKCADTVGRFSFNVKGGRCEACHGDGTLKIEMNFCLMCTCLVRSAMVRATTGKPSR